MADKKVKGAGNRFLPGSNIAKHREWRGLKDTWYDYTEWVKVLGVMGGFVAKSPVRIMRGMLTYRWMGSYLAALNMIDRCVEGLRGPGAACGAPVPQHDHEGVDQFYCRDDDGRPPLW